MNKAEQFNKWYAEHCGHPHHVKFAKSAIDEQQEEIKALKAQAQEFREELGNWIAQHGCVCYHPACNRCRDTQDSADLLKKTKKQFLADIRAEAVNDFANIHCGHCTTEYQCQLSSDATVYTQQLRDNAK